MGIVRTNIKYGYSELVSNLQSLQETYPFLEIQEIGKSIMERSIEAVRFGTGSREIHYNGSFHANEWITTVLLMKFLEDLSQAYQDQIPLLGTNIRHLSEKMTLWMVPMVNPDGVELALGRIPSSESRYGQLVEWNGGSDCFEGWKANIRGVDLNDQFPAGWEIEKLRRSTPSPGPRDYTGESPLSEPEAAAMAEFTRRHSFCAVMAFHTQGKEIYWNYRDQEPAEAESIAEKLGRIAKYKAVKLTESDAGYKDWFIQEFRRPGFTIEAGWGVNPLPIDDFSEIYNDLAGLMVEGLKL